MKRNLRHGAFVCAFVMTAMVCQGARAEDNFVRDSARTGIPSRLDSYNDELMKIPAADRLARLLELERAGKGDGVGVVLVDAIVDGQACIPLEIIISGRVNGQIKSTTATASRRVWGELAYDGPKPLPAGEYAVAALKCKTTSGVSNFVGPHAKFHVKAGELVNIGTLRYVFSSDGFLTGSTRRSIEPANAERLAKMAEKSPRLAKMMVSRPMTLIGPTEGTTRRKVGW
jgi:hypothetical protein